MRAIHATKIYWCLAFLFILGANPTSGQQEENTKSLELFVLKFSPGSADILNADELKKVLTESDSIVQVWGYPGLMLEVTPLMHDSTELADTALFLDRVNAVFTLLSETPKFYSRKVTIHPARLVGDSGLPTGFNISGRIEEQ